MDVGPAVPTAEVVSLLAGITAGLLALIGIVFALLLLVVQFAATAQSPRLHLFRDNPLVWNVLGLLIGIMVYATTCFVVVSRQPTSSVLLPISAIVLVLLAVALTRRLQLDALRSVQLASALADVSARTREVIDRLYTAPFPQPAAPPVAAPEQTVLVRWPADYGVVLQIDLPRLLLLAGQAGATVRLRAMPGDVVQEGAVVLEIWVRRLHPTRTTSLLPWRSGSTGPSPRIPFSGSGCSTTSPCWPQCRRTQRPRHLPSKPSMRSRACSCGWPPGTWRSARSPTPPTLSGWSSTRSIGGLSRRRRGRDSPNRHASHGPARRRVMLDRIRDVAPPERHPKIDRRIADLG